MWFKNNDFQCCPICKKEVYISSKFELQKRLSLIQKKLAGYKNDNMLYSIYLPSQKRLYFQHKDRVVKELLEQKKLLRKQNSKYHG